MANTNGMRFPMTAQRNFTHELAGERVAAGRVFDGLTVMNVNKLVGDGSAVVGDVEYADTQISKVPAGVDGKGARGVMNPVNQESAGSTESDQAKIAGQVAKGDTGALVGSIPPEVPELNKTTKEANAEASPVPTNDSPSATGNPAEQTDSVARDDNAHAEGGESDSNKSDGEIKGDKTDDGVVKPKVVDKTDAAEASKADPAKTDAKATSAPAKTTVVRRTQG